MTTDRTDDDETAVRLRGASDLFYELAASFDDSLTTDDGLSASDAAADLYDRFADRVTAMGKVVSRAAARVQALTEQNDGLYQATLIVGAERDRLRGVVSQVEALCVGIDSGEPWDEFDIAGKLRAILAGDLWARTGRSAVPPVAPKPETTWNPVGAPPIVFPDAPRGEDMTSIGPFPTDQPTCEHGKAISHPGYPGQYREFWCPGPVPVET